MGHYEEVKEFGYRNKRSGKILDGVRKTTIDDIVDGKRTTTVRFEILGRWPEPELDRPDWYPRI